MWVLFAGILAAQTTVSPEIAVDPRVSTHPGVGRDAAVAFNGSIYLAAWRGSRPNGLFAQRIDAQGRALDAQPLVIDPDWRAQPPLLASDGHDFLVVAEGQCTPIARTGTVGLTRTPFPPALYAYALGVAFDGSDYRVVYSDQRGQLLTMRVDRACVALDPTPALIASTHVVPETRCPLIANARGTVMLACADDTRTLVAGVLGAGGVLTASVSLGMVEPRYFGTDGERFLLTTFGNSQTQAMRFNGDGALLDTMNLSLGGGYVEVHGVAFASGAYSLVGYAYGANPGWVHLRIASDPQSPTPPAPSAVALPGITAMGSDGTRSLLITRSNWPLFITGLGQAFLEPDGALSATTPLFRESDRQQLGSVGSDGLDFLVTWDRIDDSEEIARGAARFDPQGTAVWAAPASLPPERVQRWPDSFFTSWDTILSSQLGFFVNSLEGASTRISSSGQVLDDPSIFVGRPCARSGPSIHCVVVDPGGIGLNTLDDQGRVTRTLVIGELHYAGPERIMLTGGGGRLFAAAEWQECTFPPMKGPPICIPVVRWAEIEAQTGQVHVFTPPVGWTRNTSLAFFNGANFVMLSGLGGGMVSASVVSSTVTTRMIQSPQPITDRFAAVPAERPFLAWQVREDVVGSWIAADGTVVTPAGIPIAQGVRLEDAAANAAGQAAVIYSRFVAELPYQTTRMMMRIVSEAPVETDGGIAPDAESLDAAAPDATSGTTDAGIADRVTSAPDLEEIEASGCSCSTARRQDPHGSGLTLGLIALLLLRKRVTGKLSRRCSESQAWCGETGGRPKMLFFARWRRRSSTAVPTATDF